MKKSLKKTLFAGVAALSFVAVAGTTSTSASAKSYATAGAYTALTTGKNVVATGSNAIYSKPGTVKGAKVVASKAKVAKLAASKSSADTLYAYATKTTNKNSVYYKVVTMNKKFRGYIYGGKSTSTVAGGIKTTDTTTTAATPARTTGYYLKNVSANAIWTAPKFTDINAKKVSLYGAAKTDPFTVDKAATKTKEGSLYYHVTDSKDSSISGWIYAGKGYTDTNTTSADLGGLSLTASDAVATSDNSVKIVYQDSNNSNAQVGTATWITARTDTKAGGTVGIDTNDVNSANVGLTTFVGNNVPSGYAIKVTTTQTAQYGNTLYVPVVAAATSKVSFRVNKLDGANATVANALTSGTTLSSSDFTAPVLTTKQVKDILTGEKTDLVNTGQTNGSTNLFTALTIDANANGFVGTKTYYTSDGTPYHYTFKVNGIPGDFYFGSTIQANVTATLVSGAASSSNSNTTWIS